jgi:glycosyltransferase involved in cell wall biosynthesis
MSASGLPSATVVVDLTPVLPGGRNGGAKIVALELIPLLSEIASSALFVLLTTASNHDELTALESPNTRCFRVDAPAAPRGFSDNLALRARAALSVIAPRGALDKLAAGYRALRSIRGTPSLLRQLKADVMFCPFLDPFYDDGATPFVSIVADLQFLDLPQFFPAAARARLERQFESVARRASRIVCISEHVREAVARAGAPPERLAVIPHALHRRFDRFREDAPDSAPLDEYGLTSSEYLLYPANFWPHKNHAALIRALELYVRREPDSRLKLVLTGEGGTKRERIADAVCNAGLAGRVVFAGFVSEMRLAVLLRFALGLVFPSLYEGFGMPVIEAMAMGTPVLCSNASSLPEIAGDAAFLFDPQDPASIAAAIAQLAEEPGLRSRLAALGARRAETFGSAREMAQRYWRVICEAAAEAMVR